MTEYTTENTQFVSLISSYVLHLKYYSDRGLVLNPSSDFKKFTDHFLLENSLDVALAVTPDELKLLKDFDVDSLQLDVSQDFVIFLKNSLDYFVETLSLQFQSSEGVMIRKPQKREVSWSTIKSGLVYGRNNDSSYSTSPSAYTLSMY